MKRRVKTSLKKTINGKLTLWGIFKRYKKEMQKKWDKNPETEAERRTERQYESNYEKVLGPKFNEKPYEDYTAEEIVQILKEIKNDGYEDDGVFQIYDDNTMRTFRANIKSIDDIACKYGIRRFSAFWGSILQLNSYDVWNDVPKSINKIEKISYSEIKTFMKKSLTTAEEKNVYSNVMRNPKQNGEYIGLSLMLCFGLRNSEACGLSFNDIIPIQGHEECFCLRIKTTTDSKRNSKDKGKTDNAYRYIPIYKKVLDFLLQRKEYIMKQLNISDEEVKQLPIACSGDNFEKRCIPTDLTEAGKVVLKKAGVKGKCLAYLELYNIKNSLNLVEKIPTVYLFRRHFATVMHTIKLSQDEIHYIMGHSMGSSKLSRNNYNNGDLLYDILLKMENRALFSWNYSANKESKVEPERGTVNIERCYKEKAIIPKDSQNRIIIANVTANMPQDDISLRVDTESDTPIDVKVFPITNQRPTTQALTNIKNLHKKYGKNI